MPTVDATVGLLQLPAVPGAQNAEWVDPTLRDLMAYVSHWLEWGLNDKVATMTKPPAPGGAVPVANRFTNSPSAVYLAQKLPALFIYWSGKSKTVPLSTIRTLRMREFAIVYTYEVVRAQEGTTMWEGLISTVDAIMHRAFSRRGHPTLALNGFPVGSDIRFMAGWYDIEFGGGAEGFLRPIAAKSIRDASTAAGRASMNKVEGAVQSGHPSYAATVRIWEEANQDTALDTDEATHADFTGAAGEGSAPVVPDFIERSLVEP